MAWKPQAALKRMNQTRQNPSQGGSNRQCGTSQNSSSASAEPSRIPQPPQMVGEYAGKGIFKFQAEASWFYNHQRTQYTIATLIFANFFANIIQAQIDPFGKNYPEEFLAVEDAFNYIFLVELLVNMYASWMRAFIRSGWNWFDILVVIVGILSIARVELPGPFSLLRMLRAFRVFRLFKRIKSLQKIIVSLISAVPGMLNAGFIMVLVMCIYAILAVEYFGEHGDVYDNETESYVYQNTDGENVTSMTARGLYYGDEYFGTFLRSLFTLFQVLTGESWAEAVARPALFGQKEIAASIFFISFVLVNSFVLINVVVAVLLEKCLASDPDSGHQEDDMEQSERSASGKDVSEERKQSLNSTSCSKRRSSNSTPVIVESNFPPAATANEVEELRGQLVKVVATLKRMQEEIVLLRRERMEMQGL